MSRKARPSEVVATEPEPVVGNGIDALLFITAVLTVALVSFWFKLDVNRVFDVPKALALKLGGCGAFLIWLFYGVFGRGFPWQSVRLFFAPVALLLLAVSISTVLSIDVPMSLYGVYERQFGLQGMLACVGLFLATSSVLRSRRGAYLGLAVLLAIAGIIGSYGFLQSQGWDPYGFFRRPHNKVYSTLGNATFAGNALALVFPISLMLSVVAGIASLHPSKWRALGRSPSFGGILWAIGFAATLGLQILPTWFVERRGLLGEEAGQAIFKLGIVLSLLLLAGAAMLGTLGPSWSRADSPKARHAADALGAGGLFGMVVALAIGLVVTRTRGAWVGSAVAIASGLLLVPKLFADRPDWQKRIRVASLVALLLSILAVFLFLKTRPNHVVSKTIQSIPYAFSPKHTVYGQGQGTRRFLWAESPRVLWNHEATLERQQKDAQDRVRSEGSASAAAKELGAHDAQSSFAWRKIAVWFFGIGIETYRYAFMSHKSKELEALDPMTNHDNPHNNYLYVVGSLGIFGLLAYLWLLFRLVKVAYAKFATPTSGTRLERALALGVVLSFVSYAVYSIAGFDSVACSVFFYFLLGSASALFAPSGKEPRQPIFHQVRNQWRAFRGHPAISAAIPKGWAIATTVLLGFLLTHSMFGALSVHAAERAFVGNRARTFTEKIENIQEAIRLNPYESFYRQSLGSTYAEAVRQLRAQAQRLHREGKSTEAQAYLSQAESYAKLGEQALYSALAHAWAPENIFISIFQLHYASRKLPEAELALERALEHSPHLGAVRANLAILKLERGAYAEALKDCLWVLEVDPKSSIAHRTCGRAYHRLDQLALAEVHLTKARAFDPEDPLTSEFLAELERIKASSATAPPPSQSPSEHPLRKTPRISKRSSGTVFFLEAPKSMQGKSNHEKRMLLGATRSDGQARIFRANGSFAKRLLVATLPKKARPTADAVPRATRQAFCTDGITLIH